MSDTTKVIFRKWGDGEVIALFPELPATVTSPHDCMSYMRVGQHGAATPYFVIADTSAATPEQYADLKTELEAIGYTLDVRQRITPKMDEARLAEWIREINPNQIVR